MSCTTIDKEVGCYTLEDGTKQTVFIQTEYGVDANDNKIPVATRITDIESAVIDGADATNTVAGACPVYAPDVEWEERCDVLEDGSVVTFMCQVVTSFDASGEVVVPSMTTNYELDKVTEYTPAGEVGTCPSCPPSTAQGLLTSWGSGK